MFHPSSLADPTSFHRGPTLFTPLLKSHLMVAFCQAQHARLDQKHPHPWSPSLTSSKEPLWSRVFGGRSQTPPTSMVGRTHPGSALNPRWASTAGSAIRAGSWISRTDRRRFPGLPPPLGTHSEVAALGSTKHVSNGHEPPNQRFVPTSIYFIDLQTAHPNKSSLYSRSSPGLRSGGFNPAAQGLVREKKDTPPPPERKRKSCGVFGEKRRLSLDAEVPLLQTVKQNPPQTASNT